MRLIALETSGKRGSVALVEEDAAGPVVRAYRRHEVFNEHAERMLGLIDEAFEEANWEKESIERVAVGVGPGSFTGVRVALALAQGLMLGWGVPGVGVGSLRVVAAGHDPADERLRIVVRDARRDEFFLAVYDQRGRELVAPYAIAQEGASKVIAQRLDQLGRSLHDCVVLGTEFSDLPCAASDETAHPDARPLGRVALALEPLEHPVLPQYVRGPNLVKPKLPPSPLGDS